MYKRERKSVRPQRITPGWQMQRSFARVKQQLETVAQPVSCDHTTTIQVFQPASGDSTRDEAEVIICRDVCGKTLHGAMA